MEKIQLYPVTTKESSPVLSKLKAWIQSQTFTFSNDKKTLLCGMVQQRSDFGKEKYGARLHSFNGRDSELDLQQELADGLQYLFQMKIEKKSLQPETVALFEGMFALMESMLIHE